MKKSQLVTALIVVAFVGLLVGINTIEPNRVSSEQQEESALAEHQIDEAEAAEVEAKELAARERVAQVATAGDGPETPQLASNDPYQVEFECSNGTFVLEIYPDWAPYAAARFHEIIEAGIYNEARFFRVIPNFVVQWGIPGDPEQAKIWGERTIKGEPVKESNVPGTITYAMLSGDLDSRTTQVYINLGNNARSLDGLGFSPFGKVIKGMDVVHAITSEYGQDPEQDKIETRGNAYLKEYFPKLDYIKSAKILGSVAAADSSEGN